MRKVICLSFLFFLFISTKAWPHAATEIELEYLFNKGVLQTRISHVTSDLNDHYIRKVMLYKDSELVETKYFNRQFNAQNLVIDFQVTLEDESEFSLKTYCEKGGVEQVTQILKRPKPDENEEDK